MSAKPDGSLVVYKMCETITNHHKTLEDGLSNHF